VAGDPFRTGWSRQPISYPLLAPRLDTPQMFAAIRYFAGQGRAVVVVEPHLRYAEKHHTALPPPHRELEKLPASLPRVTLLDDEYRSVRARSARSTAARCSRPASPRGHGRRTRLDRRCGRGPPVRSPDLGPGSTRCLRGAGPLRPGAGSPPGVHRQIRPDLVLLTVSVSTNQIKLGHPMTGSREKSS